MNMVVIGTFGRISFMWGPFGVYFVGAAAHALHFGSMTNVITPGNKTILAVTQGIFSIASLEACCDF